MADAADETPSGSALAATLGVRVIQSVVFLYDFLTYPIYYAVSAKDDRPLRGKKM